MLGLSRDGQHGHGGQGGHGRQFRKQIIKGEQRYYGQCVKVYLKYVTVFFKSRFM